MPDIHTEDRPVRFNLLKRPSIAFGVILAIELGSLVRLLPIALHDFPLNDGGLFYRMTEDLAANGFRLPLVTSYNGGGIPFAYPPLGFYVAAGLNLLTKVPLLELTRWLPALFSILTIPAFYFLARRILASSELATIAALIFALIPRSHTWMVMGGGLARSPGMLFSLLSILQVVRYLERPTWKGASILGVLLALVTLSHLEMAWFALTTLALLWIFRGKTRTTLGGLALALALAAALSSSWWLPVTLNHGIGPFVQAGLTGNHTWSSGLAIFSNFTDEPSLGLFVVLGFLGASWCIARRELLLPIWLFSLFILDPRAAATDATAPLAMLVALAIAFVVLPPLARPAHHPGATPEQPSSPGSGVAVVSGRTRNMVVAALAVYGVYAALISPFLPWSSIVRLRTGEAEAMRWIGANLPPSVDFLVVSARLRWGSDPLSEWFPALTHARSPATPQGKEWTGGLWEAQDRYIALQLCAGSGLPCLEDWAAKTMTHFDYVLVAKFPDTSYVQTEALVTDLAQSLEYELVYSNSEAAVFSRRPEESP